MRLSNPLLKGGDSSMVNNYKPISNHGILAKCGGGVVSGSTAVEEWCSGLEGQC